MKLHMTKTSLRAVDANKPTGVDVYDDDLAAFGARVFPPVHSKECASRSGDECDCKPKKTIKYFVRYSHGRRRRMVFGTIDQFPPEEARKRARKLLGLASGGDDPAAKKEEVRESLTFREWSDTYLEGVRKRKKAPQADAYGITVYTGWSLLPAVAAGFGWYAPVAAPSTPSHALTLARGSFAPNPGSEQ